MDTAVRELPDEPAVNGSEAQAAGTGEVAGVLHVFQYPADLCSAEIGVYEEAGLVADLLGEAEGLEGVAVLGGAAVLPYDGVVNRPAGFGVPNDGRLALVGDADGGDFLQGDAGLYDYLAHDGFLAVPDLLRVVLDESWLGEILSEFFLTDGAWSALVVENDGSGTTGPLV